jgi:hypothetical protein
MGGAGTAVTINFYNDNTFDLWTSRLRDTGVYEIVDGAINLTYDGEHPDGGDWVLTGTVTTEDVTDPLTVIIIDPVEYEINMGVPSVMNIGTTTFSIVVGPKAVITKVADLEKSFTVGDAELDWTAYFTIMDDIDGAIPVTIEMLTDNIDMNVAETYFIDITVTNSSGNVSTSSIMIFVNEPEE